MKISPTKRFYDAFKEWDTRSNEKLTSCPWVTLKNEKGFGKTLLMAYDSKTTKWSLREIKAPKVLKCLSPIFIWLALQLRKCGLAYRNTILKAPQRRQFKYFKTRLIQGEVLEALVERETQEEKEKVAKDIQAQQARSLEKARRRAERKQKASEPIFKKTETETEQKPEENRKTKFDTLLKNAKTSKKYEDWVVAFKFVLESFKILNNQEKPEWLEEHLLHQWNQNHEEELRRLATWTEYVAVQILTHSQHGIKKESTLFNFMKDFQKEIDLIQKFEPRRILDELVKKSDNNVSITVLQYIASELHKNLNSS